MKLNITKEQKEIVLASVSMVAILLLLLLTWGQRTAISQLEARTEFYEKLLTKGLEPKQGICLNSQGQLRITTCLESTCLLIEPKT